MISPKLNRDEITCPYCGYEFSNSYEFIWLGHTQNVLCENKNCEKKFSLFINKSVTYSTYQYEVKNDSNN